MLAFCLLALVPGLAPALLAAEERAVELGRDARWKDMRVLDGVSAVPGRWGFSDLVLSAGEYPVDGTAELLFHFDGPGQSDATGAWEYAQGEPALSEATAAMGQSSAAFTGAPAGVSLRAPPGVPVQPRGDLGGFHHRVLAVPRHALQRGDHPRVGGFPAGRGSPRAPGASRPGQRTAGWSGSSRTCSSSRPRGSGSLSAWQAPGSSSPARGTITCFASRPPPACSSTPSTGCPRTSSGSRARATRAATLPACGPAGSTRAPLSWGPGSRASSMSFASPGGSWRTRCCSASSAARARLSPPSWTCSTRARASRASRP